MLLSYMLEYDTQSAPTHGSDESRKSVHKILVNEPTDNSLRTKPEEKSISLLDESKSSVISIGGGTQEFCAAPKHINIPITKIDSLRQSKSIDPKDLLNLLSNSTSVEDLESDSYSINFFEGHPQFEGKIGHFCPFKSFAPKISNGC